jgi:hypothetical protein
MDVLVKILILVLIAVALSPARRASAGTAQSIISERNRHGAANTVNIACNVGQTVRITVTADGAFEPQVSVYDDAGFVLTTERSSDGAILVRPLRSGRVNVSVLGGRARVSVS